MVRKPTMNIGSVPAHCFQCEVVFPNEVAFQAHKLSGHSNFAGAKPLREGAKPRVTLAQAKKLEEIAAETPSNSPPLPSGISEADLPSPEFMDTLAQIEAEQPTTSLDPVAKEAHIKKMQALLENAPKPEPEKPKVARPIELKYFYSGDCGECKNPVKTIEVDIELGEVDKSVHMVIAYCQICNKQLLERQEKKL